MMVGSVVYFHLEILSLPVQRLCFISLILQQKILSPTMFMKKCALLSFPLQLFFLSPILLIRQKSNFLCYHETRNRLSSRHAKTLDSFRNAEYEQLLWLTISSVIIMLTCSISLTRQVTAVAVFKCPNIKFAVGITVRAAVLTFICLGGIH